MKSPESLYIHIPFCISKCSYCDFFSIGCGKKSVPQEYVDALCNELIFRIAKYDVSILKTIYIGGGTPSLLTENQLKQIITTIKNNVKFDCDYEFTIEVNPDDITLDFLNILNGAGVTRISCGIQSLNEKSLRISNRRASVKQSLMALELLKENWHKELSLDLICGLPEETKESFIDGLKQIVSFNPEHISMYSLTIEEETPFGKALDEGKIEYNSEFQDDLWLAGRDFLMMNGYVYYEVSNFAKPGKECKHNLTYWNHESYIGSGSGGCGTVYLADGCGYRWTNKPDIDGYIKFWNLKQTEAAFEISEKIDVDTSEFEFFMMGFRKLSGITNIEYEEIFGCKISPEILSVFNKWEQHSLLDITQEKNAVRYNLNSNGILLLNRFLEELI